MNSSIVDLSIVAIFYNMRREAPRTLFSLSQAYQRDLGELTYEVIAVDNGSSEPLDPETVTSFGPSFRYVRKAAAPPSPVAAINEAVAASSGRHVAVLIDGARLLSPGILGLAHRAGKAFEAAFVYTLAMHLGPQVQNLSIHKGYNQTVEDGLLDKLDWRRDGYRLFNGSSIALSSKAGFFSKLWESNFFVVPREAWEELGGMDERFVSPGGGLVNLDFFSRAMAMSSLTPVMLLGEATFHQIHGGVAANAPMAEHPWARFEAEYQAIRGQPFRPSERAPMYFGTLPDATRTLLRNSLAGLTA